MLGDLFHLLDSGGGLLRRFRLYRVLSGAGDRARQQASYAAHRINRHPGWEELIETRHGKSSATKAERVGASL